MKRFLQRVALAAFVVESGMLSGCPTGRETYPTEDTLAPGILLEPEQRAVLPPGVEIRKVSDDGIGVTKTSEGFRSKLYNDAARYCTIAYGHLIKKAPCDGTGGESPFRGGVTEPQGTELLRKDMEKAELAVMTLVDVQLTDGQYAALCDFVFNVGSGNFKGSSLRKAVNARRHDDVPFQLRRWVKAGGKEWPGLKTRREKEIELFFVGMPIPRAAPPEGEDLSPIDIQVGERQ
jgi:lysozyme